MEGYLATVQLYAGPRIPEGWVTCSGQTMSVAQNQALYALIGNTYGGDGHNTFLLPKLEAPAGLHYIICINGIFPSLG